LNSDGTNEAFIRELALTAPELQRILDTHISDYNVVLPHVLFGDISRFVISEARRIETRSTIIPLLNKIEKGLTEGSEGIRELIQVSFVENLIGETKAIQSMENFMGPNLKKSVEAICG
jgi:transcriptional regulator of NAD metabolism